nr:24-methylenesterol C-methyltransferase 2 [Tanacetum cinerariifolium]
MRTIASHSGCNIIGITINEYQVSRAKAYNQKARMDKQCKFVCDNFFKIPFEDESFDGAYSIEVTCHAPKLEDVYREIFRVLKPGSMYVSYEWVTTDLYRAQNLKHMDIIQGIERGNALPGLRSYTHIVEIAKKVSFEGHFRLWCGEGGRNPSGDGAEKRRYELWKPYLRSMMEEEDMEAVSLGTKRKENVLATCLHSTAESASARLKTIDLDSPNSTESHRLYCQEKVIDALFEGH